MKVYAVDPAGGFEAPVLAQRWDSGKATFAVRLTGRGLQSLVSLGLPIDELGEAAPGSLALSWDRNALVSHLRGERYRLREGFLGPFGAPLVFVLRWTPSRATLTTRSALGLRTWPLPIGAPAPLSAKIVTAGKRLDEVGSGAFMAFGKSFLSPGPGSVRDAETEAEQLYRHLTKPGLSWEVRPPDYALTLSRADDKALELAPGDQLTFRLAVARAGGYAGNVDFSVTVDDSLFSASWAPVAGQPDVYDVTLSASPAAPEGAVTFAAWATAQGANNPGSLLKDVRDMLPGILEVAASPAVMPNATVVSTAFDPLLQRDAEIIRDSSSNANVYTWSGYARPDRRYLGILCTAFRSAAVSSGALANAAQAQRMSGNATVCAVFAELNKAKTGGVLFQLAADNGDNGVHILKADGGLKLRTVNGAATVTSIDTLPTPSGYARLIKVVDASYVTLLDRDSGRSIRLARPAWADAGVRVTWGAQRTVAGVFSNLGRAHVLAHTVHPYALSEIQRRRNIDALAQYYLPDDGKGEFADNALVIALFNDNTAESPNEKFRNRAAPALGITLQTVGGVTSIAGGVAVDGVGDSHLFANTGIPSAEVSALLTVIQDFASGVAYGAQVAINDSAANAGNATLTRHGSQQAFPMQGKTDLSHVYTTVGPKVPPGKSSHLMRLHSGGKSLDYTELQTGQKGTVTGNVTWTGNQVLSLGNIKRAGGGTGDRTNTKNLGLVFVRGELSADDLVTSKALLNA